MKKVLFLLLACVALSGCDSGVDDRQDEAIARLRHEVDLAHEWIGELREVNRKLEFAIHCQKRICEWKHDHERLSITRMLDEAIDKCRESEPVDIRD